jgi:hypothetical protein
LAASSSDVSLSTSALSSSNSLFALKYISFGQKTEAAEKAVGAASASGS